MAIVLPAAFTAVDKVSSVVRKIGRNIDSFAQKAEVRINRVDRAFNRLTPSIGKTFKQLLAFASFTFFISQGIQAVNVAKDFEQANANLASVMGTTVQANKALAKDAERLGSVTAKSAIEVVSLQEAYARLGFTQTEILDVTEATISGSIAMNAALDETANLTGAMIRTFDKFSSADAPQILDQMTLATQKSALNFEKLNTALPIVSGAANAAGINFSQLLALLGKLSDAGIDASSSSTSLRNIFLESAKRGESYDQILARIVQNQDKLTAANDKFGKRAAVSGVILANNLQATADLTATLDKAAKGQEMAGVATATANKQLDTFQGSLTLLQSAIEGLIIKISNSTGALGGFRNVVDFVTKNIETIAKWIARLVGLFILIKAAILLSRTALIAYNIILGITGALSGKAAIGIGKNIVALKAYRVAATIASIAAKVWAVALNLGIWPITLIALGIAALIGIVTLIIKKWEKWGAALSIILGPIGLIIGLIQSLRKNWEMVKNAFKTGGIIGGLKAIGKVFLDVILFPVQQLLQLLSKLPGKIGSAAEKGALKIQETRENLGVNTGPKEVAQSVQEPANIDKVKSETFTEQITKKVEQQNLNININDPTGRTNSDLNGNPIPVALTPTF